MTKTRKRDTPLDPDLWASLYRKGYDTEFADSHGNRIVLNAEPTTGGQLLVTYAVTRRYKPARGRHKTVTIEGHVLLTMLIEELARRASHGKNPFPG